jgi:hypothetical protein
MAATVTFFVTAKVFHMIQRVGGIRMIATVRERAVIAIVCIKVVINVAMEVVGSMKPRPGSNEHAARKPLGAIVAVRRAVIRRIVIISVRANGSGANINTDAHLSCLGLGAPHQADSGKSCKRYIFEKLHNSNLSRRTWLLHRKQPCPAFSSEYAAIPLAALKLSSLPPFMISGR